MAETFGAWYTGLTKIGGCMGGYELTSPEDLPSTPAALLAAADHAPTAAMRLLTTIAAEMTSTSTWDGLVGRGLVHGNLHTQAYAAELMVSGGLNVEEIERLVALRAGRSALLLAKKVR